MKEFVIGDMHGGYRALVQCLERSKFNYDKDRLICLGDVADGWTETAECFEELFKIKNLVYVRGNHDQFLKDWLKKGKTPDVWVLQGGQNTIKSYYKNPHLMKKHLAFLAKTPFYYHDESNRVFVHGGVSQKQYELKDTDKMFLCWDRTIWDNRKDLPGFPYDEVYVGHTSIWRHSETPINVGKVWYMDTGGGWEGKLSIMDINTKEVFQSDVVADLYPESAGRDLGLSPSERLEIIKLSKKRWAKQQKT